MLAAAAVPDASTQNTIINQVHAYAASNRDNHPFDVVYNPTTGAGESGSGGSPAQGAVFSILALK